MSGTAFSEPVDHEIFQGNFLPFVEAGMKIGEAHAGHAKKSQVPDGGGIQGNGIVKKFMKIEYA